jgi:hypothetical protein
VTDFTDEDVQLGAEALVKLRGWEWTSDNIEALLPESRAVLAAVLPAHDKRVRAEAKAEVWRWLESVAHNARADAEEAS